MKAQASFVSRRVAKTLVFGALLILFRMRAQAQDPSAQINTQQDVTRRAPVRMTDESAEPSVADPDLGELAIVSRTPRPDMFTFSTGQDFHYTSNAFLLPNTERATLFWNGRFDASYVPYAARDFTPRLTFEQNFFRYERFSELDFDSQSLQLDLKYDLKRDDSWYVNVSYAVARLYAPHSDENEFYRYGIANASLTHVRQLWGSPVYFAGSGGVTARNGAPSAFDRFTAYANAAVFYSPLEHLQLSAFVRPEGQAYTNDPMKSSRKDFNLNVGAAAVLTPIEYVSLGVTANFTGNYSNSAPAEYDVFSPSLVVSGRIAF